MGSPSTRSGRVVTRRHRRRSGQPGATSALRPVCERMARAGRSRRSLVHRQLAAIRLRLSQCTLAGNRAPTASPGGRTREKKRSGRGRPPRPPPMRRSQRTRGRPSVAPAPINYAARSSQPAAGAPGCAMQPGRGILSRPHTLDLPRLRRELAHQASQVCLAHHLPEGLQLPTECSFHQLDGFACLL